MSQNISGDREFLSWSGGTDTDTLIGCIYRENWKTSGIGELKRCGSICLRGEYESRSRAIQGYGCGTCRCN